MRYRARTVNRRTIGLTVLIGCSLLVTGCAGSASSEDQATEFWEAIESRDIETALGLIDPEPSESNAPNLFGRAHTLEGNLDWYDAVDWEWALDECAETDTGSVECRVAASNAWSRALGVEPVEANYEMQFGDAGIQRLDEWDGFEFRWLPRVFDVFAEWVSENQPADAEIMFNFDEDIDPEMLGLYRINSERFVDAISVENP